MNNYHSKLAVLVILCTLVFTACKPEKSETVTTENYKGVFVVNEGGFLKSNGTIGLFKPGTSDYFDAFEKANGRPLGDIVQSMTLINGKYFIVVNNSNKIEVVNQSDFKSIVTIPVNQPRNIIQVSASKAYVSQLNSTVMTVINLNNNSVLKTINIKSATDNMAVMLDNVYVSKAYSDMIYMVNTTTDVVMDSLVVGSGLSSIVNIGSNQIGLFCLGIVDFTSGNIIENGKVAFINSDSNKIARIIPLSNAGYGGSMTTNGNSNPTTLYYTFGDSKLYQMSSNSTTGASSPFITISGSIYGVNTDLTNGNIYIMDAGDFNSAGRVYIYNNTGVFQKEFVAGIVPSEVVFNY